MVVLQHLEQLLTQSDDLGVLGKGTLLQAINRLPLTCSLVSDYGGRRWVPFPLTKTPNGKRRPLGILTIQDRVVQMVLKMLLEPIFEADFLNCSYGFRPERRTMDCLVPIWRHVNSASKHYWVVEGDIRAYFDNVNHDILLGLLRKRIADPQVLDLIAAFLKAGVMEGHLFKHTEMGTPQGSILSPLLSNVYLHQFDLWWWNHYGSLTRNERRQRRRRGLGHPILIRYADDWILLWNGNVNSVLLGFSGF